MAATPKNSAALARYRRKISSTRSATVRGRSVGVVVTASLISGEAYQRGSTIEGTTGCSSVLVERRVWDSKAASSSLATPTDHGSHHLYSSQRLLLL